MNNEKQIKIGDKIRTPRFLIVRINDVFPSEEDARSAGYNEPTHYNDGSYGILGKAIDQFHMVFAAYVR